MIDINKHKTVEKYIIDGKRTQLLKSSFALKDKINWAFSKEDSIFEEEKSQKR